MVIATGIGANGTREVLGVDIGDSKDETFWSRFLRSLKKRGLAGRPVSSRSDFLGQQWKAVQMRWRRASRRLLVVLLIAAAMISVEAHRADAGGTWMVPEQDRYAPGDSVTLVGFPGSGSQGSLQDGPFFGYLYKTPGDDELVAPRAIPLPVGEIALTPTSGMRRASITFELPDYVKPGRYYLDHCNLGCTARYGDLLGAIFWVGHDGAQSQITVGCDFIIDSVDSLPGEYVELADTIAVPVLDRGMQVGRRSGEYRFSKFGMAVRQGQRATVSVVAEVGDVYLDYGAVAPASVRANVTSLGFAPCETETGSWVIYAGGIWTSSNGCVAITAETSNTAESVTVGVGRTC